MKPILASTFVALTLIFSTQQSAAEGSMSHSAAAVHHSAEGLGYASIAGAQVVSGVVAVPLMGSAQLGQASDALGDVLWATANDRAQPLPVTDKVISAGPAPDQALQSQQGGE
jgi:hypothetical protein